jgi:hypothetical protein
MCSFRGEKSNLRGDASTRFFGDTTTILHGEHGNVSTFAAASDDILGSI